MTLEHFRAHWIASPARTMLLDTLHGQMTDRLAAMFPGSPVSSMAAELATVALHAFDAQLAKPIAVDAGTVTITDHRS